MNDENESQKPSTLEGYDQQASQPQSQTAEQHSTESTQTSVPQAQQINTAQNYSAQSNTEDNLPQKKPLSRSMVRFLRFLVIGSGLFGVFIVGLGISFSACFTIKGPPPPECAPISFVSLILMPGASLLFLIPLAKKIK